MNVFHQRLQQTFSNQKTLSLINQSRFNYQIKNRSSGFALGPTWKSTVNRSVEKVKLIYLTRPIIAKIEIQQNNYVLLFALAAFFITHC